ncbi:uncharacterized protein LOC125075237 [Vanessa atalanta]|uniref:uncharacterized protein LOC125075237 n=1 Tax=Vanessa atalanta TaxID=42275 RepID=UPI001FCD8221|nr:uncharacterized protein LOC125075237 [Vanessa atalanta]
MLFFAALFRVFFICGLEAKSISEDAVNPRSVNLNLRTSFQVDNDEGQNFNSEDMWTFLAEQIRKICQMLSKNGKFKEIIEKLTNYGFIVEERSDSDELNEKSRSKGMNEENFNFFVKSKKNDKSKN